MYVGTKHFSPPSLPSGPALSRGTMLVEIATSRLVYMLKIPGLKYLYYSLNASYLQDIRVYKISVINVLTGGGNGIKIDCVV